MTGECPARYREEYARGPGHGHAQGSPSGGNRPGAREPKGTGMRDDSISAETFYVGTTMALIATQAFAVNLAVYLSGVERVDGTPNEDGADCVRRLVDQMMHSPLDTAVTDLPPDAFDAEMATQIAFDSIRMHAKLVLGNL